MAAFLLDFEWDPNKALANLAKHNVDFESAAEVFQDPLATTIPDDEHTMTEARWVTLGKDSRNRYVLVVHTFEQSDGSAARVRIISARRPTKTELHSYEEHA